MSQKLRELTRKGDPMLRIKLPELVQELMQAAAKENKRKVQDEVIKRLAASFKNDFSCTHLQKELLEHLKH